MSQFAELTIHTTTEGSELIADCMWNYTDFGVTISDVNDIIDLQKNKDTMYWDYIEENAVDTARKDVLVKCYLPLETADETRRLVMGEIREMVSRGAGAIDFGSLEDTKRIVDGDEWIEVWKKHFRPIHLGRIVVVPEWIEYEKKEGEEVILLDSNMAFGTGEHETTSMCVEYLQEYIREDSVCIDVGCGSGILGISAIKLGAKKAYLTDIDPVAVDSANHNAKLNGVADKTIVAHSDLLSDAENVQGDIMMANITAEILAMLAPSIPKNLKRDGVLILSGIIADRLDRVKEVYASVGMQVIAQRQKGEWFALVLTRA